MEAGRAPSPLYARQKSMSGSSAGTPSSPSMSPIHRHVRSGSAGVVNFRRQQNTAARAAAQRLARVMAHQHADADSSDEDDDAVLPPPIELSTPRRANRSPSPAIGHYLADQSPSVRPTSTARPAMTVKPTPMIPPIKPLPKPVITSVPSESPVIGRREKRMSLDLGNLSMREPVQPRSSSSLQDEIDVLQEENENILEKLRLAEERCEEAEARAKQLEKQVASLGEGVSLEARLLSRKEVALQQREAALKAAAVKCSVMKDEEIAALQMEAKSARDKATSVVEHLLEAETEIKSLRTVAQNMILNQEEKEELVLKRCWLARYWKLCVQHGIHSDIAEAKNEYWSSFARLPLEVVLSAGQKAREGPSADKADHDDIDRVSYSIIDFDVEENIESMLLVEKGLRELVLLKIFLLKGLIALKVEEVVLISMAKHRCSNIKDRSLPC